MTEDRDQTPQEYEQAWWGDCANTYNEETKQLLYAQRMGIGLQEIDGHYPVIDLTGKSVVDIGGGPSSLLLKAVGFNVAAVIDPCPYPEWVEQRYQAHGVMLIERMGETLDEAYNGVLFEEAWIYNCLQHVEDPERIVANARKCARFVRLFEWIDIPPHEGHPHELTSSTLHKWLGGTVIEANWPPRNANQVGRGHIDVLDGLNSCYGKAFYGVFEGAGFSG